MSDNKTLFSEITAKMKITYPNIDSDKYEKYLQLVYGGLAEIADIDKRTVREIVFIEENMISRGFSNSITNIGNAYDLIKRYSDIAFFMAKKSYSDNFKFILSDSFKKIIKSLYESEYLTAEQKRNLKNLISEIFLDLSYSSGNHAVSSIRMSSVIRR